MERSPPFGGGAAEERAIPEYSYKLDFKVRDSECDMQGVVNNACYQVYLEHARHEFIKEAGVDFAAMADSGINLTLVKAEIEYKHPLRSGDSFWIGVNLRRASAIRFAFMQDIYLRPSDILVTRAVMIGVALNRQGRPFKSSELERLFKQVGKE